MIKNQTDIEIIYPSSDGEAVAVDGFPGISKLLNPKGEPLAETYVHLYAILVTLEILKQYIQGQQATVLADQFLYYAQGFPRLRVAPDVMVIFNVTPGGRDNYKIWEEKQVPSVIFEITSEGTKDRDTGYKKTLYEQLGVKEYWLFDPKGEWIENKLKGFRLGKEEYEEITDSRSEVLGLRLEVESELIAFYREDTGEKLLAPSELSQALRESEEKAERLRKKLEELGVDPDTV